MKNFLLFTLTCLISSAGFSQKVANVDWNVDATQENIIISYDLIKEGSGTNTFFQVSIKATLNDRPLNIISVSGDVGNYIKAGAGKRIVWAWASDVTEIEGNLKFVVQAVDPLATTGGQTISGNTTPKTTTTNTRPVPPWAGITGSGGAAVTGLALGITGLTQITNANELYSTYETNLDPTAAVYSETSREDLYTEANSKFKKGQYFAYGGGIVLAAGAYLMVSRIVGYNKLKKKMGFTLAPAYIPVSPAASGFGKSTAPGLRLSYRF